MTSDNQEPGTETMTRHPAGQLLPESCFSSRLLVLDFLTTRSKHILGGLVAAAVMGLCLPAQGAVATWIVNGGVSNWSSPANWLGGIVPSASGDVANFTAGITAATTINLDQSNYSVGVLNIGDADASNAYTLSGGNTLTLDDGDTSHSLPDSGRHFRGRHHRYQSDAQLQSAALEPGEQQRGNAHA